MDTKTKAIVDMLSHQRNSALDAVAAAYGELAAKDEQIAELKKQVAEKEKENAT